MEVERIFFLSCQYKNLTVDILIFEFRVWFDDTLRDGVPKGEKFNTSSPDHRKQNGAPANNGSALEVTTER